MGGFLNFFITLLGLNGAKKLTTRNNRQNLSDSFSDIENDWVNHHSRYDEDRDYNRYTADEVDPADFLDGDFEEYDDYDY